MNNKIDTTFEDYKGDNFMNQPIIEDNQSNGYFSDPDRDYDTDSDTEDEYEVFPANLRNEGFGIS